MMAHSRDAARTFGKSDPIDALAVARAALREPQRPTARLDGPDRDIRLVLADREDLVAERTRIINRLRWHLREIDPSLEPPARGLIQLKHQVAVERRLEGVPGLVARLARELVARCRERTTRIRELEAEIQQLVAPVARRAAGSTTTEALRVSPTSSTERSSPTRLPRNGSREGSWSDTVPRGGRGSRTSGTALAAGPEKRRIPKCSQVTRQRRELELGTGDPRGRRQRSVAWPPHGPRVRRHRAQWARWWPRDFNGRGGVGIRPRTSHHVLSE